MEKANKLLNLMMADGASEGEILNARNMLKKLNVKLTVGNNQDNELMNKYSKLLKKYEVLYNDYNSLYKEYKLYKAYEANTDYEKEIQKLKQELKAKQEELDTLKSTDGSLEFIIFILILLMLVYCGYKLF